MNDDKLLQQDEVDALLKAAASGGGNQGKEQGEVSTPEERKIAPPGQEPEQGMEEPETREGVEQAPGEPATGITDPEPAVEQEDLSALLTSEEKDALGEIGNISMGSAATTLSQLLNKRVNITSPTVNINNKKDFLKGFNMPFLVIKVKFKEGFDGYNVLIIKLQDAIVMANLMMGGDGTDLPDDISEMEISAAAEAMNQMIGTASTSLADLLGTNINIMPPETDVVRETNKLDIELPITDPIVVISFRMKIEDLLDTSIMQVIALHTAREQSELLWNKFGGGEEEGEEIPTANTEQNSFPGDEVPDIPDLPPELGGNGLGMAGPGEYEEPVSTPLNSSTAPDGRESEPRTHPSGGNGRAAALQFDQDKLDLLLDIPLKVSVVLGRTRKQIRDVLHMTPGAIVELETVVGEPVEILVNGKLVARGEVVVVNENFGVKLTHIISTRDRINTLGAGSVN